MTRSNANWLSTLLLASLLLSSCDARRDFRRDIIAFGTVVNVTAYAARERDFTAAADTLEQRFAILGSDWYVNTPGELKRANDAIAAGQPVEVSADLKNLIEQARLYEHRSGGLFNIGIGRIIELWGFYEHQPSPRHAPGPAQLARYTDSSPGTAQLHWDGLTLTSSNPDVMLDLGGIAKGTIIQIARRILQSHGIDNAIINIGGDLLVIGQVNGHDARIGIRSPEGGPPVASLSVHPGEAVFTSGNYERFVIIDGHRFTHIIDPTNGMPVEHTASVTVVNRDPVLADAAATALLVGGPARFDALVTAFDLKFALLIDASGDASLTPGMQERLNWAEHR